MNKSIITLLLFNAIVWISSSQTMGYAEAECAGLPITSLPPSSNIADIINAGPSFTQKTYFISNAPIEYAQQTPRFTSSAVDPISGNIYVIVDFRNSLNNLILLLGILDTANNLITLINPSSVILDTITAITFDCNGILYGIDTITRTIYIIDKATSNMQEFENGWGKNQCGSFVQCNEVLSYNYDNSLFYRISSKEEEEYLLFVRENDVTEMEYTITDPNGYCTSDSIRAMEWIGNGYFLISCDAGIYLLDTRNIAVPEIIDIAAAGAPAGVGIIPSNLMGSVCVPPSCVATTKYAISTTPIVYGGGGDDDNESITKVASSQSEEDAIIIEEISVNTGDDDMNDGDGFDLEDNSPDESYESDKNELDEDTKDLNLFEGGNKDNDGMNNDGSGTIDNGLFMFIIFSWSALVLFLIGSIVVFCCQIKNKQNDFVGMQVAHVEKI